MDNKKTLEFINLINNAKNDIYLLKVMIGEYDFDLKRLVYKGEDEDLDLSYLIKDSEMKINLLESIKYDYEKKLESELNKCDHKLILIYGSIENNLGKLSECLVCGQQGRVFLKEGKYILNKKEVEVLDLSDFIKNNLKDGYNNKVLKMYGCGNIINAAKYQYKQLLMTDKNVDLEYIKNEIKKEVLRVIENNYNKVTKKLSLE